ncbi:MAG: MFS transporter [Pseudomonadota bacterium]
MNENQPYLGGNSGIVLVYGKRVLMSISSASGRGWVLAFLFFVNLLNYIDRYVLPGILPLLENAFPDIDKERLGDLALAFIWIYLLTSPIFGFLGDRIKRKILIGIGVQLWSLATAAGGFARNFHQLFFTRMFVGVGEAAYGTTAPAIISDLYPKSSRGRALAFFYVAIPLGAALGYLLGGMIGIRWGWRSAFYVVGLPGLLAGLIAYWIQEPIRGGTEGIDSKSLQEYQNRKISAHDYLRLLLIPSYVINCLGMTAYTYAVGGISWWLPTYIHAERNIPLDRATLFCGIITAATGIIGTLAGGILADRLAKRWRGAYFWVCGTSMLLSTPFIYWALTTESTFILWSTIIVAELLLFLNTGPSNTALVNVTEPKLRTTAVAANIFFIHAAGDGISPKIMGAIADRKNLTSAFKVTNAIMALSGILWLLGTPFLGPDTERVISKMAKN